jgi:hypothetical protein
MASRPKIASRAASSRPLRRSVATASATESSRMPSPAARLGQVDQLEVQGEGGDDGLARAQVQAVQLALEALTLDRIVLVAQGDGALADALDEIEQGRPRLLIDDLAQERTEQADFGGEGVPGAGGADPARFTAAGHGRHADALRNQGGTPPQPFATTTLRTLVP